MVMGLAAVVVVAAVGLVSGATRRRRRAGRVARARLGRLRGVRRVRPVHGLPAAGGERHADPRPGARAARVRRRAVRAARATGSSRDIAKFVPTYGLAELVARAADRRRRRASGPSSTWSAGRRCSSAARPGGSVATRRACDPHADGPVDRRPASVGAVRRRAEPGDARPRDGGAAREASAAYARAGSPAADPTGHARRRPVMGIVWAVFLLQPWQAAWDAPHGIERTLSLVAIAGLAVSFAWVVLTRAGPHGSRARPTRGPASCSSGRSSSSRSSTLAAGEEGLVGLVFVCVSAIFLLRDPRALLVAVLRRPSSSSCAPDRARLGDDRRPRHLGGPRVRRRLRVHAAGAAQPAARSSRRTRSPCSRSSGSASGSPATCTTSSGTRLTVIAVKAELAGKLFDARRRTRDGAEIAEVQALARAALADVRGMVAGDARGDARRRAGRRAAGASTRPASRPTCPAPSTRCPTTCASCSRGRCARARRTCCGTRRRRACG